MHAPLRTERDAIAAIAAMVAESNQRTVAETLGLSQSCLSRVLAGKTTLSERVARSIGYEGARGHIDKRQAKRRSESFWSKVDKTTDCWNWTASVNRKGYGRFGNPTMRQGYMGAHRFSWVLTYGEIPDGKWVLHKCDNPRCVRPDHLFLGDAAANVSDQIAKDRWLHGSRNPMAKLTEASALEIREIYSSGNVTYREIGSRFGISPSLVGMIVRGKSWRRT